MPPACRAAIARAERGAGKECHAAIAVADPDLGGPGIEIEEAFFSDLGCGIGGGEDLDANLRGAGEPWEQPESAEQ